MTRVMVIGNAGGGKSTLCGAIVAAHGLPYTALDKIMWQPGWVRLPSDHLQAKHDALLAQESWLIDGYGPMPLVQQRLEACDTIIFVDHPLRVHLWWATKRQLRSLLFGRRDAPDGCPMWRVTLRLYKMIWALHREMRPALTKAIYAQSHRARIIHITSPAALRAFSVNPV